MPVPEHDKSPATTRRYRQAHYYGEDGWTDSQSCRRPILHVPDSVCDWLVLAQAGQARHVARCTLLVARYSLLVARCLWGGSNTRSSQPVSHSPSPHTRVQGLQAQNTSRTRCSYMCFITWTIVVLMSNSNISPVARTTFLPSCLAERSTNLALEP